MVVVVVRPDHELDVLDSQSAASQARLERIQRLIAARAGVDQGEGVSAQQPRVDRPDVRQREVDCVYLSHIIIKNRIHFSIACLSSAHKSQVRARIITKSRQT